MAFTYLVFTKKFGILRITADNIKAARGWGKRSLGNHEVVSVVREHKGGATVGELEDEWREIVARRWPDAVSA